MAKLLAERASRTLYKRLNELMQGTVSADWMEDTTKMIQLSAVQVNKSPRKSKLYDIHKGSLPFEGQSLTEERKAIRNLVQERAISDLTNR